MVVYLYALKQIPALSLPAFWEKDKLFCPENPLLHTLWRSILAFDYTSPTYEERTKAKKKAEIEARKAAIRTEDIAKGVFIPVSSLPQREPQKGAKTA